MATPLTRRPALDGTSPQAAGHGPGSVSGTVDYRLPGTLPGLAAEASAMLGMLTGLWVALSPWFITLQTSGGNAQVTDVIAGLVAAAMGGLAIVNPRGYSSLQIGSLLLGTWLIISPGILHHTYAITHAMYWSNCWAGGILVAMALTGLASASRSGR